MTHRFLERLAQGPLLADGAMGTMLYANGVPYERCFDELNLSEPDLVQRIHREYIAAGAGLIETNTFGANRIRLSTYGLEGRVRDINYRGVRIAREAREIAGESVFVAGAVGPIGQPLAPVGSVTLEEAQAAFAEQIEALLEGGADLIILETFSDLSELQAAIAAARSVCDLPLVAQLTFTEDGRTLSGHDPATAAQILDALPVDVIGINCGVGPQLVYEWILQMAPHTSRKLSALPNAGFPARIGGRFFYFSTPAYFAEYARKFAAAGVALIGGCCGTTPAHIAAMGAALQAAQPRRETPRVSVVVSRPEPATEPPAPPSEGPTLLAQKLARKQFVVSVELDPPRGLNPKKALQGAAMLKECGVDCINIGDSPMAKVRMSAIGLALLIQQQVGLETIIHCTTRDRNLMALQSDLLGAHALGIRNVLALTGDPPRLGNYPNATGVWDVDSIGLITILKRFNEGVDWHGTSIGRPASFFVGCAVTPTAEDMERELERFRRKVEAGADFVMSQPLFSMAQLEAFLDRVGGELPIPHILGILPLESYRHAEFLHHEVPGITIPDDVRERMRLAGENGRLEGLRLAQEFIEQARPYVAGVYIITSYGRYDVAATLVRQIRAREPISR
jgi:homocysteine S-methyltransferase